MKGDSDQLNIKGDEMAYWLGYYLRNGRISGNIPRYTGVSLTREVLSQVRSRFSSDATWLPDYEHRYMNRADLLGHAVHQEIG